MREAYQDMRLAYCELVEIWEQLLRYRDAAESGSAEKRCSRRMAKAVDEALFRVEDAAREYEEYSGMPDAEKLKGPSEALEAFADGDTA